jgi:hypothetical protein
MKRLAVALLLLIAFMLPYINSLAGEPLELYGFGVRSCDYLALSEMRWEQGEDEGALAYMRLEEWMAGFVSALSLATGEDVTRGAGAGGMVRQVVDHCRRQVNRDLDVFGATMELIRTQRPDAADSPGQSKDG